jgi:hypothetical protein
LPHCTTQIQNDRRVLLVLRVGYRRDLYRQRADGDVFEEIVTPKQGMRRDKTFNWRADGRSQ